MKNIMRRAVAFMLMACLLLSVMAPTAMAVTKDETAGTWTYTWATEGHASNYRFKVDDKTGDFCVAGKNVSLKQNAGSNIQVLNFASTSGAYFALSFAIGNADTDAPVGTYDLSLGFGTGHVVDVYIIPSANYSDGMSLTKDSTYYVGTTSNAAKIHSAVTFKESGTYVISFNLSEANTVTGHAKFTHIVFTPATKYDAVAVPMHQGVYSYGIEVDVATQVTDSGYATDLDDKYGDFVGHSTSDSSLYKPYSGYLQIQETRTAGNWYALRFAVDKAGNYDIALDINMGKATESERTLDVHIVPVNALTSGVSNTANNTAVEGFTNGHAVTLDDESTHTITNFNFASAGEYLIVFELTAGEGIVNFNGMTLHPYTVKGLTTNTMYGKVNAACEKETSIQLTAPVSQDIAVTNGATLDLNGQTVYGNVVIADGQIVDNVGNGGVVGTLNATGNNWLPLYDGTAYRFFEYTTKSLYVSADKSESGNDEYWFDVDFTKDAAYTLLANTSVNTGIDLSVTLSWSGSANGSKTYALADYSTAVSGWLAGEIGGEDYGMALEVTNVPDGTSVSVTPAISANGATITFDAITNG